jgi:phosphoglycerate dehydrogenase-like enzyme
MFNGTMADIGTDMMKRTDMMKMAVLVIKRLSKPHKTILDMSLTDVHQIMVNSDILHLTLPHLA